MEIIVVSTENEATSSAEQETRNEVSRQRLNDF